MIEAVTMLLFLKAAAEKIAVIQFEKISTNCIIVRQLD